MSKHLRSDEIADLSNDKVDRQEANGAERQLAAFHTLIGMYYERKEDGRQGMTTSTWQVSVALSQYIWRTCQRSQRYSHSSRLPGVPSLLCIGGNAAIVRTIPKSAAIPMI